MAMPRGLLRSLALTFLLITMGAATARAQIRAELVASGLTQPVALVQDPSDATVQLVVQQNGRIRILKSGAIQSADYLDLSAVVRNAGEQGLLGLAFSPDYASSGRVFVNFNNLQGHTVVARFTRLAGNPLRADPATRFDLLWPNGQRFITHIFSNHNGGNLVFGPDNYLYIGMGDGGGADDPDHNAQNPLSLFGKMLRIDVSVPDSDAEGYNIPPTNPFVGRPGVLAEIWSLGLRNPWRWSFDNWRHGGTGAMVIADVGQSAWEEINYEPAGLGGRNYGWRNREGAHNNVTSLAPYSTPLTDPIFEYSRSTGRSITGGYVYRGATLGASFRGRYVFADFVDSRVWSVRLTVNATTGLATASDFIEHTSELGAASSSPSSFGEDAAGEIYLLSYAGSIYRLAGTGPAVSSGHRRPANVTPIGWATPRPGLAVATAAAFFDQLASGDVSSAIRLLIELLAPEKPCSVDSDCRQRACEPGPDNLALGHFTLGRGHRFVPFDYPRNTALHQLRCAQSRDDGEFKLIHFDRTADH